MVRIGRARVFLKFLVALACLLFMDVAKKDVDRYGVGISFGVLIMTLANNIRGLIIIHKKCPRLINSMSCFGQGIVFTCLNCDIHLALDIHATFSPITPVTASQNKFSFIIAPK